jgi:hypothetical protein
MKTKAKNRVLTDEEFEAELDAHGIPVYPENPWLAKIRKPDHFVVYRPSNEWLRKIGSLGDLATKVFPFIASRLSSDGSSTFPLTELSTWLNQPVDLINEAIDELVVFDLAQRKTDDIFWLNPEVYQAVI